MKKDKRRSDCMRAARILLLDHDDPKREMDFEIDFQMSLTMRQRYKIMDRLVKEGLAMRKKRGHKNIPSFVIRP